MSRGVAPASGRWCSDFTSVGAGHNNEVQHAKIHDEHG